MIHIQHLTKKFGRFTAVDDLSFQVEPGKIVGFLGPNGAGKTTTLRMLTGFLPPTSGTATVAGHDISKQSLKVRSKIGYMPENVPLYDDMRVREYLKFRANIKGIHGRQASANIAEVLELCALQHMRNRMINTLSKGYRQRVGLADALVNKPELLVLDEPTNGLDPNQIRSIRRLIKELGKKHTILVSSHILSEIEMIANHVVIIDNGKIKASDTPENLTRSMRYAGKISLEIKGSPEVIQPALERLDNIKKVIPVPNTSDWLEFEILCEAGTDSRERIHRLASQYGWSIRTLHRHQATLEDIFVEMTRRD